jgi:hypothetical protein
MSTASSCYDECYKKSIVLVKSDKINYNPDWALCYTDSLNNFYMRWIEADEVCLNRLPRPAPPPAPRPKYKLNISDYTDFSFQGFYNNKTNNTGPK